MQLNLVLSKIFFNFCEKNLIESKEDVVFKGRRYVFEPSGIRQGKHQFAMELAGAQGTIDFPSTIIVSSEGKLYQSNSFINIEDMLYILKTIREALLE